MVLVVDTLIYSLASHLPIVIVIVIASSFLTPISFFHSPPFIYEHHDMVILFIVFSFRADQRGSAGTGHSSPGSSTSISFQGSGGWELHDGVANSLYGRLGQRPALGGRTGMPACCGRKVYNAGATPLRSNEDRRAVDGWNRVRCWGRMCERVDEGIVIALDAVFGLGSWSRPLMLMLMLILMLPFTS